MRRSLTMLALGACGPLLLAGCATSISLPAFVSNDVTGSIAKPSPLSPSLDSEDWRRAQGALGVALDPQGNGAPVAWNNPQTGAKGSFSPVGDAYAHDEKVCRVFLADLSGSLPDATLQGDACRDNTGDWKVGRVKPWKR